MTPEFTMAYNACLLFLHGKLTYQEFQVVAELSKKVIGIAN